MEKEMEAARIFAAYTGATRIQNGVQRSWTRWDTGFGISGF